MFISEKIYISANDCIYVFEVPERKVQIIAFTYRIQLKTAQNMLPNVFVYMLSEKIMLATTTSDCIFMPHSVYAWCSAET